MKIKKIMVVVVGIAIITIGSCKKEKEGIYHLYFNLPDLEKTIYGNPDYSIRLANEDVWESSTGYNNLLV